MLFNILIGGGTTGEFCIDASAKRLQESEISVVTVKEGAGFGDTGAGFSGYCRVRLFAHTL
jgi:hypothetical protein